MNNNYLKYNNLGILVDSQLEQVSQGNHNVDAYYIAYDVYDYTNGYVTVSVTLPDGTQLPEFATSPKDFEFGGNTYKGFVFVLRDTLTSQSGNLSMTFNLKSVENDTQLCSSRLNVLIHESDVSVAPTITQEQYDQMQEVIRENTVKSNEALQKANDALYHDATIVKVNGVVQQTWDATYAQKLTEESLNDLDIPNTTITSNGVTVTAINGGIVINGTPTATAVIDIPINLNVGTETYTYAGFNDISKGYSSDYIAIRGDNDTTLFSNSLNSNNKTFNASSSSWNVFRIRLGTGNTYNNYAVKPMLVKGNIVPPKFETYNQNKHITNAQADFLKSEYDRSLNLYNNAIKGWVINTNSATDLTYSKTGLSFQANSTGQAIGLYLPSKYLGSSFGVKSGKVYTYVVDYELSNSNFANIRIEWGNKSSAWVSTSKGKLTVTQKDNTISTLTIYVNTTGFTSNLPKVTITNIMILEGDYTNKALPSYQEWNGYPLHPKDITPVTLWENASPTSDFTSVNTNLTTLDRSTYVRLRMWYSDVSGSCYKYVDFANIASNGCWLSGVVDYEGSNQHMLTRKIIMSKTYPTTINFGECYENNSVAPKRLVPIKLEGLYY